MQGTPPSTTITPQAPLRPADYRFSNSFFNNYMPGMVGRGMPQFNGKIDPGMSPSMQMAMQMAQGYGLSPAPFSMGQAQGALGSIMGGGMNNWQYQPSGGAQSALSSFMNPRMPNFGGGAPNFFGSGGGGYQPPNPMGGGGGPMPGGDPASWGNQTGGGMGPGTATGQDAGNWGGSAGTPGGWGSNGPGGFPGPSGGITAGPPAGGWPGQPYSSAGSPMGNDWPMPQQPTGGGQPPWNEWNMNPGQGMGDPGYGPPGGSGITFNPGGAYDPSAGGGGGTTASVPPWMMGYDPAYSGQPAQPTIFGDPTIMGGGPAVMPPGGPGAPYQPAPDQPAGGTPAPSTQPLTSQGHPVITQGGVQGIMGAGGRFQPLGPAALRGLGGGGAMQPNTQHPVGGGGGPRGGGGPSSGGTSLSTRPPVHGSPGGAGGGTFANTGGPGDTTGKAQQMMSMLRMMGGGDKRTHYNTIKWR